MKVPMRYMSALTIQVLGPLLMLLLSLTITKFQGAEVQGEFAATRAWIDFIVAVGLFGLPQSIVLAVNRADVSRHALFMWAKKYVLYGCIIITAVVLITSKLGGGSASLPLVIAAASWVLIGIWRSILLTIDDGVLFNIVTIIPTIFLVIISGGIIFLARPLNESLSELFFGAGLLSVIVCFFIVRRRVFYFSHVGRPPDYRRLFIQGFDMFVINVSSSLQIYFCYHLISRLSSSVEVGYFSIALLLLNAFNFPLQSLAPLLLNRWSKLSSGDVLRVGVRQTHYILVLLVALSFVSIVAIMSLAPLLFKDGETPPDVLWLLIFSVTPAFFSKICALRLASLGMLRFNSMMAVVQLSVFSIFFIVLAYVELFQPIGAAVVAWLVADTISSVMFFIKLRTMSFANL